MFPARHLWCTAILLGQPNVAIERCTTLNMATLLPIAEDGEPHDFVAKTNTSDDQTGSKGCAIN